MKGIAHIIKSLYRVSKKVNGVDEID